MDFIVNTGDHYYSAAASSWLWDITKLVIGPVLGVIGAYAVSWAAFQRDKKRTKKKEQEDLASYAKLYVKRLEYLMEPTGQQVTMLRSVARQLERPGNDDFQFSQVSRFNFEAVATMDASKLFNAFVLSEGVNEDERLSAYLAVTGCTAYFCGVAPLLPKVFDSLSADFRMLQENWGHGMRGLDSRINSWAGAHVANEQREDDPFLDQIVELFARTFNPEGGEADLNMAALSKSFIDPLFAILNTHHTDPRCPELAMHAGECRHAILNLEKVKSDARTTFLEHADGIEKALSKLRNALALLTNEGKSA